MPNYDLETRLRAALHNEAGRAPSSVLARTPWHDAGDDHAPSASHRHGAAWLVLGVAAAVAVVSVGTTLTVQAISGGDTPPPSASTPTSRALRDSAIVDPVPVGLGSVVVDVPGAWARGAQPCAVVETPSVLFETGGQRACGTTEPTADTVSIERTIVDPGDTTNSTAPQATRPRQDEAGFTVVQISAPAQGVEFGIRTRDAELAAAISDSIRVLEAGQTTVPDLVFGFTGGIPGLNATPGPAEVTGRLQAAGLGVEIRYAPDTTAQRWGSVTPSVATGTVVPTGTTIVVTYGPTSRDPDS